MARHVLLLRAVNLGARNKVPMVRLRQLLTDHGYAGVATLLASGNVVLDAAEPGARVAATVRGLVAAEFGVDTPVLHRSPAQLRQVLRSDPIPGAAEDPKRYTVTFLAAPAGSAFDGLDPAAYPGEWFAVRGREVFAWYPNGLHASRLARDLARLALPAGTARNWDTVRALVDLAYRD